MWRPWQAALLYLIVLLPAPCLLTAKRRQNKFRNDLRLETKLFSLSNGTHDKNGDLRLDPQTWRNDPGLLKDPLENAFIIRGLNLDSSNVDIFRPRRYGRCRKDTVNRCGEVCHCINGRKYCCRQRKDWDALSRNEKRYYLTTVRNLATGRLGSLMRNRYQQLLRVHEEQWYTVIHQKLQFLPWHRIYMLKFENLLRSIDCRLTVPYWDWTKRTGSWWQHDVFGRHHFGINLNRNGGLSSQEQCPSTGYFAPWTGFTDLNGRCLVRQFSYNLHPATYIRIQQILRMPSFHKFESSLRYEHGVPHYIVGGDNQGLFFTSRAAEDPLFFLHHSNVDFQWYQRQVRYPQNSQPYEFWSRRRRSRNRLVGFEERIRHALNPFRQGLAGTCVEYVENDTRYTQFINHLKSQKEMGNLKDCKKSNRFPSSIFTLFKSSRKDRDDFLAERNKAFC